MIGGLGGQELIIVLVIIILIFGVKQLPKIGKSLGEGIREFRNVGKEIVKEEDDVSDKNH